MNEGDARVLFKKYLRHKCPICCARSGQLCVSDSTWIHAARWALAETPDPIKSAAARSRGKKPVSVLDFS